MSVFTRLIQPVKNWFNKSWGESQISRMVGETGGGSWSYGFSGGTWNRQELGNHYTGFNYLAIQPLMKEISGMTPHAAFRHDGMSIRNAKNKAMAEGRWDDFRHIGSQYLNAYERSKAIAPIQTHEELEPVGPEHELVRLLRNPNGPDTAATFFRKLVMYWRIYGEFYIWLVPPKIERLTGQKRPPVEMWVLPSSWVWPQHDPENKQIFSHFEIRPYAGYYPVEAGSGVGLGWFPGGTGKHLIPADQIVFYAEPNPTGFFNGYSPLTAISHWIDCSDSIDRARTSQFQNGAFPGVVLEFDKTVVEPDQAMLQRLEARINSTYAGVRRTGKSMILSPGVKMRPLDNKPYEMAYTESAEQIKDWVFAAQGTGQSIVGLVEQTTFNNVWGARANFYSNTIKPMCQLLGELFTEKIARLFDPSLVVYWPDTTPVDPDLQLRELIGMLDHDVLTINEVAAIKGYAPKPWGDMPLDALKFGWAQAPAEKNGLPGKPPEQDGQIPADSPRPEVKELGDKLGQSRIQPVLPKDTVNRQNLKVSQLSAFKNGTGKKHRDDLLASRLR